MSMTMFPKKAVVAATVLIETTLFHTVAGIEDVVGRTDEDKHFVTDAGAEFDKAGNEKTGPNRNMLTFASYNTSFEVASMDEDDPKKPGSSISPEKPGGNCNDCIKASEGMWKNRDDSTDLLPYGPGGNFCTRNVLAFLLQQIQLGTAFISCPEDSSLLKHIFANKGELYPKPIELVQDEKLAVEGGGILAPATHDGVWVSVKACTEKIKTALKGASGATKTEEEVHTECLEKFERDFLNRGAAEKYELDLRKLGERLPMYQSAQGLYISQMWNTDVLHFDGFIRDGPVQATDFKGNPNFAKLHKRSVSDAQRITHYLGDNEPRPAIATLFKLKNFDLIKSSAGEDQEPTLLTFAVHGPHLKEPKENVAPVIERFGEVFNQTKIRKFLSSRQNLADYILVQGDLNKSMSGEDVRKYGGWHMPLPTPSGGTEHVSLMKPDVVENVTSTYPGFTHPKTTWFHNADMSNDALVASLQHNEIEDGPSKTWSKKQNQYVDNYLAGWMPDNVFFGASSRATQNFAHKIWSYVPHSEGIASDHRPLVSLVKVVPAGQTPTIPINLNKVYGPHSKAEEASAGRARESDFRPAETRVEKEILGAAAVTEIPEGRAAEGHEIPEAAGGNEPRQH